METKEDQRKMIRRRLSAMTPEERLSATESIHQQLFLLPELLDSLSVYLYASLPKEVGTDLLLAKFLNEGRRVVLPRVNEFDKTLCWHAIDSLDQLELGPIGIREPRDDIPPVSVDVGSLLIVPGVAFDHLGYRLGRGGGYYDRVLTSLPKGVAIVGLFYSCQELPIVVRESHDACLPVVITEKEVQRNS